MCHWVLLWVCAWSIEANLKLAGFENIKISDIKYKDELIKQEIQTQEIVAEKPESKRNYDVAIEIKKTVNDFIEGKVFEIGIDLLEEVNEELWINLL